MSKIFAFLMIALSFAAGSCKSGGQGNTAGGEIPDSILNQGVEISEEVMQDIVQNIS